MERTRQLTQNLNKITGQHVQIGASSIGVYQPTKVRHKVELPSRVEGRTVRQSVTDIALFRVSSYDNLCDYLRGDQIERSIRSKADVNGWTLDDIPDDVMYRCDAWADQQERRFSDFAAVARLIASRPVDRMKQVQACPDCRESDEYKCHTCGAARQLYAYPLVRLRDRSSGDVHEVPFDAALYIDQHPEVKSLKAIRAVDQHGQLSAAYRLEFAPDVFSKSYVEQATNGQVVPGDDGLVYADDGLLLDCGLEIEHWDENHDSDPAQTQTSQDLLASVQQLIAKRYAERVESIDYNSTLERVRSKLGAHGLKLFYHWQSLGMGDWSAGYYAAADSEDGAKKVRGISYAGDDAYDALVKFDDMLQQTDLSQYENQYLSDIKQNGQVTFRLEGCRGVAQIDRRSNSWQVAIVDQMGQVIATHLRGPDIKNDLTSSDLQAVEHYIYDCIESFLYDPMGW